MLTSLIRTFISIAIFLESATNMHNKMINTVIRSLIVFFDSNPTGRIVTRFSKDLVILDMLLTLIGNMVFQGIFRSITVAITVAIINYWVLIPGFICLLIMFYYLKVGSPAMIET
mmetsp:Transcript_119425/g.166610  ORF Transcript_119425/g.166610 Transcript_119425/m.166610 type:complete len:115 (+) Transcript_119425:1483-1827(+)